VQWAPGQIVRHGDLGPWNTVWAADRLVGLIDWDSVEPGSALEDLAQLAWYTVPLRDDQHARAAGFATPPDRRARLRVLCDAYGAAPAAVLALLPHLQRQEIARTAALAERGLQPWVAFAARGDCAQIAHELAWLTQHTPMLLEA
jgi:aminoglycoside phosphotransferase (APT) family kinase protein